MAFNVNSKETSKTKSIFLGSLLFVFCALLTVSFAAVAEYEQSLEELTEKLGAIQDNEELDSYLTKAYSGDQDAQFKLGAIYSSGESNARQDHEQSAYWYKKAAEQGHDTAQYNLGHKYLEGKGVEKDIAKAIKWWEKAAEQQHELAQFNLGRAYYLGIGVKKNIEKSRLWFTQAANNNEVRSMAILKKMNWDTPSTETALSDKKALDSNTGADNLIALNETNVSNEIDNSTNASETSIAIYTNPVIKPLLITFAKSKEDINVITEQDKWLKISSKTGLPVWMHQDFIKVNGKLGTIIGSNVNTRSVPMITRGSIVGRLNKNEKVQVIEQKGEWVRILSPNRFKGWIKKYDHRFLLDASKEAETETALETTIKADTRKTSNVYKALETSQNKIKKTLPETETNTETKDQTADKQNNKWQIK